MGELRALAVDRAGVVDALGKRAAQAGRRLPVLLEVNVAGEASKQGADPAEAPALVARLAGQEWLRLRGLMTMAPLVADPEEARLVFRALRQLRDDLRRANPGLMASIAQGDFAPLLAWLRTNVHGKGSIESTDEVLIEATGDRLGTAAFKAHLETRYLSA